MLTKPMKRPKMVGFKRAILPRGEPLACGFYFRNGGGGERAKTRILQGLSDMCTLASTTQKK